MGGGRLSQKETPWCTIVLVVGAIVCHTLVLVGNLETSSAMAKLGSSTKGWSKVGLGIARSLEHELDEMMSDVSEQMVDTLRHMNGVQEMLDTVVSVVGSATDQAVESASQETVAFLQAGNKSASLEALRPVVMNAVDAVLNKTMEEVTVLLDKFLEVIKPVLEKVGEWITRFGDKVLEGVEHFSVSLDKVQKIFDQLMSQMHGTGDNLEEMLFQSWGLMDVSNHGFVTEEDLMNLAQIYSIQSLEGDKPKELMEKYDADGNGRLSEEESVLLLQDPSIPGAMPNMLRRYARALSEVAGNVGAARMRDEIALAVTQYFQIVCAKNQSKVEWVSDALGNGSMTVDFTAAVYAQLCLNEDSPNQFSTVDVGAAIVDTMYGLHPQHSLKCMDLMANSSWWELNGFNPFDQPKCVEKVTKWFAQAKKGAHGSSLLGLGEGGGAGGESHAAVDSRILDAMPAIARSFAESNMHQRHTQKQQQQARQQAALFSSVTSKTLATRLLGGSSCAAGAGGSKGTTNAERAANGGVRSRPETLRWAQWLKANATRTADERQAQAFNYSSESSSAVDSISTQLHGMAKRVSNFVKMMEQYATPAGIERLESTIKGFALKATADILDAVEEQVESLVNETLPKVDDAITDAVHDLSDQLAHTFTGMAGDPIENALEAAFGKVIHNVAEEKGINATNIEGAVQAMAPKVTQPLMGAAADKLSDVLDPMLEGLKDKALTGMDEALSNMDDSAAAAAKSLGISQAQIARSLSAEQAAASAALSARARADAELVAAARRRLKEDEDLALMLGDDGDDKPKGKADALTKSPVWLEVVDTLRSLTNLVPTAVSTLKKARKEVSKAATNLNSVFGLFESKGPAIFEVIAKYNNIIWIAYYCLLVPLTLLLLYYGFWAGGYFGGPRPLPKEDRAPPQTLRERCGVCCASCMTCCMGYHDTSICFWSSVILLQVFVLVTFLVSIVLCILAGVKAFITSGCAEVYLLGDNGVCAALIHGLKGFVNTFFVEAQTEHLEDICPANNLLTCQLIASNMKSSTLLTTVCSFLGTILSLQMIVESAVLHEQAKYRRMYAQKLTDGQ